MADKKTCYNCAYRGSIPGDCHSKCHFDWANSELKPPSANAHGVRSGWYMFPLNYDPVWQTEECKAYSEIKEESKYIEKFDPFLELLSLLR